MPEDLQHNTTGSYLQILKIVASQPWERETYYARKDVHSV